jgi:hypothetical protein
MPPFAVLRYDTGPLRGDVNGRFTPILNLLYAHRNAKGSATMTSDELEMFIDETIRRGAERG